MLPAPSSTLSCQQPCPRAAGRSDASTASPRSNCRPACGEICGISVRSGHVLVRLALCAIAAALLWVITKAGRRRCHIMRAMCRRATSSPARSSSETIRRRHDKGPRSGPQPGDRRLRSERRRFWNSAAPSWKTTSANCWRPRNSARSVKLWDEFRLPLAAGHARADRRRTPAAIRSIPPRSVGRRRVRQVQDGAQRIDGPARSRRA